MSSNSDSECEMAGTSAATPVCKTCSWCKAYRPLVSDKTYCHACADKMFRECARCHQPFPDSKYFEDDNRRCNSCHKKYLREREKRILKQQQQISQLQKRIVQERRPEPSSPPPVKPKACAAGVKRALSTNRVDEWESGDATVDAAKDEEVDDDAGDIVVMGGKRRLVLSRRSGRRNNNVFFIV